MEKAAQPQTGIATRERGCLAGTGLLAEVLAAAANTSASTVASTFGGDSEAVSEVDHRIERALASDLTCLRHLGLAKQGPAAKQYRAGARWATL